MNRLKQKIALALSILLGVSACSISERPDSTTKSASQEIVGGVASNNASVLAQRIPNGPPFPVAIRDRLACSATKVANSILTTALHCVAGFAAANQLRYYSGANAGLPAGGVLEGAGRIVFFRPGVDFAVVVLNANPAVAAMPVRTVPLLPNNLAAAVNLVGYGRRGPFGPAGLRFETWAGIVLIRPIEFVTRQVDFGPAGLRVAGGCPGDSGGAGILFQEEAGVMVRANCQPVAGAPGGITVLTRIDIPPHINLIRAAIGWRNRNPLAGPGLAVAQAGGSPNGGEDPFEELWPPDPDASYTDDTTGIGPFVYEVDEGMPFDDYQQDQCFFEG